MTKKSFTGAKTTQVKVSQSNSQTRTSDFFSNKPFILGDIEAKKDAAAYKALRNIFQSNRTTTYSFSEFSDIEKADDLAEVLFGNPVRQRTKMKTHKTEMKRSRSIRKKVRSAKMWQPV
ncbi:MAG: hypothetical protein WCP97_03940 [bacterium]